MVDAASSALLCGHGTLHVKRRSLGSLSLPALFVGGQPTAVWLVGLEEGEETGEGAVGGWRRKGRLRVAGSRPGDEADVFHTFFGVGGLSLLGFTEGRPGGIPGLKAVDPVYALPVETLQRMGLPVWPAAGN